MRKFFYSKSFSFFVDLLAVTCIIGTFLLVFAWGATAALEAAQEVQRINLEMALELSEGGGK